MAISVLAVLGRGVVDADTPVAAADDEGLTRGDGCFEGLRLHRPDGRGGGACIDEVDRHLARMSRSAAALGIAFDETAWRGLVDELAAAWSASRPDEDEAAVKLVLSRGRTGAGALTGYGYASPLPARTGELRRDGVRVVTLSLGTAPDAHRDAPWLLGGVKTLSYAVRMAAQREAERRGADDALFTDAAGGLLEGPTWSVVWATGRTLTTVSPAPTGVLVSTTVDALFERAGAAGWTTVEGRGSAADLRSAEAVLVVSAVRGPLRMRSLDGADLPWTPAAGAVLSDCRRFTGFG